MKCVIIETENIREGGEWIDAFRMAKKKKYL